MKQMTKPQKRHKLGKLEYNLRLYGAMRRANQDWHPQNDMAARPFPRAIQMQTVNACQAACKMCPYPVYKNIFPRGRMDDALFDKLIREIADREECTTFIPMLQNEPFLDKHLLDKVRRFKEMTCGRTEVELVTNGAFLTDETIAQIRESRLDVLDISLDAISREVYRKIRVGLDYDTVMDGVNRVLEADLPDTTVFVRLVRQRDNVDEVKQFARYWRKRGVPVFIYSVNNRGDTVRDFESDVEVPPEKIPFHHRLGRRLFRQWMGHCPLAFGTSNILHNGDVLICAHDWARNEVVGNVRDQTIAEVWNGPRMRELRRLIHARRYQDSPACRNCSLVKDGWF